MRAHAVVIAAFALIGSTAALANGATSERKAGGLQFKKTDTIAIASEDLFVSFGEVRVAYVYRSKAPAAQTVTMAFPFPEVPVGDGPDSIIFNDDKTPDVRNFMNFAVEVDGKPVTARLSEVARLKNKDVTARLVSAGIPLIYVKGGPDAMAKLAAPALNALVKEGLFSKGDSDPPTYEPNWTYQVVFEWEQSFSAGDTRVEISYKPITGDMTDYGDYFDSPKAVRDYCVDKDFRAGLKRHRDAGASFDTYTLGYVLKTAKFWSGPIERFRLVVDKGKTQNMVTFCPKGSKKISDTQFEWTATNYSPARDLTIVFFYSGEN